MNAIESVRAHAARAMWASVCAVLLAAVTAHAANPSPKQENPGQSLPVLATVPTDEAVKVRPDTAISFQLDTQSQEYRAFREQLESGRFAIQVEDGTRAQLFVGAQRSNGASKQQASAGEVATFDAQTGTVSTPALGLRRYTTYTVTLAVKAAYEALLRGEPLPGNDSVTIAFITGSALYEPTHYGLSAEGDLSPRVTGKVRLGVSATDDYGNAARGSLVSVRLLEDGSRLVSSAQATPAQATLPESGAVSFDITDTEAEGVRVEFQATGTYPESAWSHSVPVRFRPELPARALLGDVPAQARVGTQLTVKGSVVDVYGNAVEDGTSVSVGGQAVTTQGGAFSATQLLPTRVSDYTLQVLSGSTVLGSAVIHLLPGEPSKFQDLTVPASVVVASRFEVCGKVTDAYGNAVLEGTAVTVNGGATTTRNGSFCASVTAPTKAGAFDVLLESGTVSSKRSVLARGGVLAAITDISVPASMETHATFQACATATDAHGNPVVDGSWAYVQGGVGSPSYVFTTTQAGRFCGQLKAPGTTSSFTVDFTVYDNPTYRTVTASKMTRAVAPPPANISVTTDPVSASAPANGYTTVTLTAYVTDQYGKAVENNLLGTWKTTLGTVAVNNSYTSGGKVSARVYSSVMGTASVTVTVGSVSRTVSVTFTNPAQDTGVASVRDIRYAQGECYGQYYGQYKNYGYGSYYRVRSGCYMTVKGMAYTSSGAPALSTTVTVTLNVAGTVRTSTAYTDYSGQFTTSVYVSPGYGAYVTSEYDYNRWRYVYWDWGDLSITSNSGKTLFTDKLYVVYRTT